MAIVNVEMPEEMASLVLSANKEEKLKRNAMMKEYFLKIAG